MGFKGIGELSYTTVTQCRTSLKLCSLLLLLLSLSMHVHTHRCWEARGVRQGQGERLRFHSVLFDLTPLGKAKGTHYTIHGRKQYIFVKSNGSRFGFTYFTLYLLYPCEKLSQNIGSFA